MSRARMRIPKIIKNFEDAVRVHEMKGTYHPNDWEEIEANYKNRKEKLINYIMMLMDNCQPSYIVSVKRDKKNG